jgi:plastocyanin
MRLLPILLLACAAPMLARAGTITGTVSARGKEGTESSAAGGKYDSRQFKFVEKINYAEMRDFVVFIEGRMTNAGPAANLFREVVTQKEMKQKDAMFRPHILPVRVGTKVGWPNEDDIFHNVFSMSEPKEFDLGLYKKGETNKVIEFDKPGRVDVFCSIHSQMHCVVLVVENPFFTVTDAKGRFTLAEVPPGTYRLKAWHERLPPQVKEIAVPASGEVKVDFTLGVNNLPKY